MKLLSKRQPTMMSKKFFSMLLGGTLGMLVVALLLMSDSIIAGIVIGPDAVAGVTLVTPLYSLAAFFASVFSLGVPIIYAREMGKFNKDGANRVFGFGVLMSIIVGIALFLLISLFGGLYLRSGNPSDAILAQAQGYLFWIRFTILVMPLQTLLAAMVYSDGDETVSTISYVVQFVGNIAGSIILSQFMGIRGIGLASFLSLALALVALLPHFKRESNSLRWGFHYSFAILKEVVRYSIIDASSYLFIAALTGVLNTFVSTQFGPEYLILVSAIALVREFQLLFEGIGETIGPILSVYVGEQSHAGLRSIYSLANKTAIVEGIAVTVVLVIFAPMVPRILHVAHPELAHWIVVGIRLTALGTTFTSLLYLLTSYYLVIEQIALGVVICALRDAVMSIALAVVLGKVFGLTGLFIGLAVAPALAFVLVWVYLTARYGREDCPLLLSKVPGGEQTYLLQLSTEPVQIMELQQKVGKLLEENEIDKRTVGKVKLLIEELYMYILEKNDGKPVLSECTIFLEPEGVRIITKDDGILFDISEDDVSVTSFSAFVVSAYMYDLGENRRHLTTMSFNRSAFLVKPPDTIIHEPEAEG